MTTREDAAAKPPRCASSCTATPISTTCSTRPSCPDAEYDKLFQRAAGARGRAPRAAHARFADAARRRQGAGGLRQGAPQGADAVDPHRDRHRRQPAPAPSTRACARELGLAEDAPPVEYVVRAQVRRPGDQPALRARRAGAGRHARRRRDRRGRHAEHPHGAADPAAPARPGRRRRCWRCAARSTCAATTSRRSTSASARRSPRAQKNEKTVRQPAQCRGRRGAPARSGDRAPAAAELLRLRPRRGHAAGAGRARACHAVRLAAAVRMPGAFRSRTQTQRARGADRADRLPRGHRRASATRCPTTSTAWSTRSTASRCSSSSASSRASRAGRWRTSTRRRSS